MIEVYLPNESVFYGIQCKIITASPLLTVKEVTSSLPFSTSPFLPPLLPFLYPFPSPSLPPLSSSLPFPLSPFSISPFPLSLSLPFPLSTSSLSHPFPPFPIYSSSPSLVPPPYPSLQWTLVSLSSPCKPLPTPWRYQLRHWKRQAPAGREGTERGGKEGKGGKEERRKQREGRGKQKGIYFSIVFKLL